MAKRSLRDMAVPVYAKDFLLGQIRQRGHDL